MSTYYTVIHLPATRHGMFPDEWKLEHQCDICEGDVEHDQLITHAQAHECAADHGHHASTRGARSYSADRTQPPVDKGAPCVTYCTYVAHLPATRLGMFPDEWKLKHTCDMCWKDVDHDQLITHAQTHECALGQLDRSTS